MAAPFFSLDDFAAAFQNLLPQGKVWPRDVDSVQYKTWRGLGGVYQQQAVACAALLVDAFPATTLQLLPEWELTLGLPDACSGVPPTVAQRVAQVVGKITLPGGQSAAYFIALAARLGFSGGSVKTFAPFRVGRSHMGDPLGEALWAFTWVFNAPDLPISYFLVGKSTVGSPLYALGGQELQCTIAKYAPAHTTVLFSGYT